LVILSLSKTEWQESEVNSTLATEEKKCVTHGRKILRGENRKQTLQIKKFGRDSFYK
jgi:hypothetical protein